MSILGRFSDVVSLNIHALLDRAENPERLLAHLLRTLEEGLADAKLKAARAIAGERRLRRELGRHRAAAQHWKEQARLALARRREDLARRALACKIDHDAVVAALEVQHRHAHQLSADVKMGLQAFNKRLAEARHRHTLLLIRTRSAEVRLQVEGSLRGDLLDVSTRFDQVERRLVDREDDLLAQLEVSRLDGDLEADLGILEQKKRIEEELQTLKKEGR
jgi:phage shock protein A